MPEERFALAPAMPASTMRAERRLPRQPARIATTAQARLARSIARRRTTAHRPAPSSQIVPQAQHHFPSHSMGATTAPARSSRRPQPARPPASRDDAESSARETSSRLSMQKAHVLLPVPMFGLWLATAVARGKRAEIADVMRRRWARPAAARADGVESSSSRGWRAVCDTLCAMLCYVLYCMCIHAHAGGRDLATPAISRQGLNQTQTKLKPNSNQTPPEGRRRCYPSPPACGPR
jgi:hypothetical protein